MEQVQSKANVYLYRLHNNQKIQLVWSNRYGYIAIATVEGHLGLLDQRKVKEIEGGPFSRLAPKHKKVDREIDKKIGSRPFTEKNLELSNNEWTLWQNHNQPIDLSRSEPLIWSTKVSRPTRSTVNPDERLQKIQVPFLSDADLLSALGNCNVARERLYVTQGCWQWQLNSGTKPWDQHRTANGCATSEDDSCA